MSDRKGARLFVNLGASQTRRRLQGFGHGVRKVESTGRNQAVIVHTATGRHLSELQARFADVGFAGSENDLSEPIENLLNLGAPTAAWLREAGIRTISDLRRLGPAPAYRMVRQRQPQAGLNLLWALAAGLEGRDWRQLSEEEKASLRAEIEAE